MSRSLLLTLGLVSWLPVSLCGVTTDSELAVLEGGSLIIPCHYEPQYAGYVKYWCQGSTREFCTSLVQTDDLPSSDPARDKVSISDDPVHLVFTVTMTDLKEGDTGWYMCGVKIGGGWTADEYAFSHINVIHGMMVPTSRVSGEEGGSVTVECLYSERYRESEKKWCQSGNWSSCRATGSDGSYQDASVALSDDRSRAFTITLKRLQLSNSGWYWCMAGQQKSNVHVLVTPRTTTAAALVTNPATPSQPAEHLPPQRSITDCWYYRSPVWESLIVCFALALFLCGALFLRKRWNQHRQDSVLRTANVMKSSYNRYSADVDDMEKAAFINGKKETTAVPAY